MEGYYTEPSAGIKEIHESVQGVLKYIQFSVKGYPDGLIGSLGWMSALLSHLGRYGSLDYVVELKGCLNRCLLPLDADMLGNVLGEFVLAEISYDVKNLCL